MKFATQVSRSTCQDERYKDTLAILASHDIETKTCRTFLQYNLSWLSAKTQKMEKLHQFPVHTNTDHFNISSQKQILSAMLISAMKDSYINVKQA